MPLEQIVEIIGVQYRFLDFFGLRLLHLLHISHPCACHGKVKGKLLHCLRLLIEDGAHVCQTDFQPFDISEFVEIR
jgi:hypothetical protein